MKDKKITDTRKLDDQIKKKNYTTLQHIPC